MSSVTWIVPARVLDRHDAEIGMAGFDFLKYLFDALRVAGHAPSGRNACAPPLAEVPSGPQVADL